MEDCRIHDDPPEVLRRAGSRKRQISLQPAGVSAPQGWERGRGHVSGSAGNNGGAGGDGVDASTSQPAATGATQIPTIGFDGVERYFRHRWHAAGTPGQGGGGGGGGVGTLGARVAAAAQADAAALGQRAGIAGGSSICAARVRIIRFGLFRVSLWPVAMRGEVETALQVKEGNARLLATVESFPM